MNLSRFDELTKVLARATSWRQALKTIAATTLDGIFGLGGSSLALAQGNSAAPTSAPLSLEPIRQQEGNVPVMRLITPACATRVVRPVQEGRKRFVVPRAPVAIVPVTAAQPVVAAVQPA